jgi:signal peptidase I
MAPQVTQYRRAQPVRIVSEPSLRHRGRLGAVKIASSLLLAAVIALILTVIVGMALGLWRFAVIDTGSMRPTLYPGDVAVLTSEPTTQLKRGQIVAFHPPGEPRLTVIHRVWATHLTRRGLIIRTKGDANNALDPWHARIVSHSVWREALKVPLVGYLAAWGQQRVVRFALLVVIVVLATSILLSGIWRPARHRPTQPTDGQVASDAAPSSRRMSS